MAYFKTRNLSGGVYSIYEPAGVGCHLIVGSERALLIDTGYGFGDIALAVKEITDKPVVVVNTHIHPDHSMGNNQFEEVAIGAGDLAGVAGLQEQYEMFTGFMKKVAPPLGLIIRLLEKKPKSRLYETRYTLLAAGGIIELGGRSIEVLEMPGHTKGSVVFLDRASRTVFAGDAVNRGMFLYFDKTLKLAAYAGRLEGLAQLQGFDWLATSHSAKKMPFVFLPWYAEFLRRADPAKSKSSIMPLVDYKVLCYTEKKTEYGNVSVFYNKEQV
jgi:glyoxylase-like metal-dependent hydrolase (beta-lactamase superfamily II)